MADHTEIHLGRDKPQRCECVIVGRLLPAGSMCRALKGAQAKKTPNHQVQSQHDGYHGPTLSRALGDMCDSQTFWRDPSLRTSPKPITTLEPRMLWPIAASLTRSGYEAGDVIGDHDHALCYIMDGVGSGLPRGLRNPRSLIRNPTRRCERTRLEHLQPRVLPGSLSRPTPELQRVSRRLLRPCLWCSRHRAQSQV